MSLMEQWARENGVSDAELRAAGMASDQRQRRLKKQVSRLREFGLSQTQEAKMLARAVAAIDANGEAK